MKLKLPVLFFLSLFVCSGINAQSLKEALRLTDNEQYELANDAYKSAHCKRTAERK